MKAAMETQRPKRQEEHVNFISWCFVLLCDCIPLALVFLLGRVAWLQVISPDMPVREDNIRSLHVQQVSTSRGMIIDYSGCPLAASVPVKAIWADPREVHGAGGINVDGRWKTLANALNIPLDQFSVHINASPKGRSICLVRRVGPDMADCIKKLKLPGIHLREELRHYYPSGEVIAHFIGFTNADSQGIESVEKSFDKQLIGQPGEHIMRKGRYDRIIGGISSTDSRATRNLTLSIDERLQALVYRELDNAVAFNEAEPGDAVPVDVDADGVLAMTNSPSYSPNNLSGMSKEATRNRTTTDVFEPGLTVKPMAVMTTLQRSMVRENSVLNTVPYRVSGHEIKDVAHYSELALTGVLRESSNVGVSKLVLAIPSPVLVDAYSHFGPGKATNLGLVRERSDLYPQKQRWSDIERITFSFGYGLMIIPLQLARVYATTGGYGTCRPLSIIKVDPPVPDERVFPESIVRTVVRMMENVALPGGGDVEAAIRGYRVTIKTSTAKRVGPDGRYVNKYIAHTTGVAPADQPRFVLVIVINSPQAGKYYDGAVSTPVFGAIVGGVLRIMNIEPDALITGDKNESMINQGEGTGGRS